MPPRLYRRRVQRLRHELPGDAGHQDASLRRKGRATSRIRRASARLLQPRGDARHHHCRGDPHRPGEIRQARSYAEQVRWGFEHLNLTEARLKELGAAGSCSRSRRAASITKARGMVKFQQWDGTLSRSTPFMDRATRLSCARWSRRPPRKYAKEKRSRRATARRKAEPPRSTSPAAPACGRGGGARIAARRADCTH